MYDNKGIMRNGSRREMGRGIFLHFVPSLEPLSCRFGALRNPGHGSRKLSTLKLNRKAKPSLRVGWKATDLWQGEVMPMIV